LEWIPTERRILVSTCSAYAFPLGQILLSGWAYLFQKWRWLQFSTSASFGITFLFALALPESACWLITHNKLHVAVKTLQKVAWINGQKERGSKLTVEGVMSYIQEDLITVKPKSSLRDLFQTPAMGKMTLCIIFLWFSSGFAFYGISLNLQKYGLNIYLVQVLLALIDFPARLLAAISMSYLGNRFTLIFCGVFSGCTLIAVIFVPQDMAAIRLTLTLLGKGSLGTMILCLHLFTLELYPTEIRKGESVVRQSVHQKSQHSFLSAFAASFLIETHGLPLLETIQETDNRMKRTQSLKGNDSQDVQERPALLIPEMPEVESTV
ncbi:solute carrier family 22 member 20-like, partial [Petaurus breviceps papuanus]|uniref:solute carrier family 22 member 20-like n=1 Tax=Petaurus breviceps papuanus TaxID=3040969 RepID=UPI0036DD9AE1